MAENTENLSLYKKDPATDGADTFNIRTMLNDNWDQIDAFAGETKASLARKADLVDGKVPVTQLPAMDYDSSGSAAAVQKNLDTHTANKNNPHAVTAAQVGADPSGTAATVQTNLDTAVRDITAQLANNAADLEEVRETANRALAGKTLIATFTASGTFTIANYGLSIGDVVDVYLVGGGTGGCGSGGTSSTGGGGGGGGGHAIFLSNLPLSQSSFSIVIGSGGSGGAAGTVGSVGGYTSAFGRKVMGGSSSTYYHLGADGGSGGGSASITSGVVSGAGGSGGNDGGSGGTNPGGTGSGSIFYSPTNPYDFMTYGNGGGGGALYGYGAGAGGTGAGSGGLSGGGTGGAATRYGCGGGGGGGTASTAAGVAGGAGKSGVVFIYAKVV